MYKHAHIDIEKNQLWFGEKSPYCVTVTTVTLYVPVTAVEQWLLILNLIYTQSKHPSSLSCCSPFFPSSHHVFISSSIFIAHSISLSHLHLLPFDLSVNARSYSVQLTNTEWEDRRSLTDNHTLSLPCFFPRQLWQGWHTGDSNLITFVPHHTLCLWPVELPTVFL